METTKTTKEATLIAAKYYGEWIIINFTNSKPWEGVIDGFIIDSIIDKSYNENQIESFRITSLRSLGEMTKEELFNYCEKKEIMRGYNEIETAFDTAASIHYLESIGIDTMNLKDATILIKD